MSRPLPYVGFAPLRPGRIHMLCPRCGRKQSNMPREKYDPPTAVLVRIHCEKCSAGGKDGDQNFRDAHGRDVCGFCGRARCERAGGAWNCDERLIAKRVADWRVASADPKAE